MTLQVREYQQGRAVGPGLLRGLGVIPRVLTSQAFTKGTRVSMGFER